MISLYTLPLQSVFFNNYTVIKCDLKSYVELVELRLGALLPDQTSTKAITICLQHATNS